MGLLNAIKVRHGKNVAFLSVANDRKKNESDKSCAFCDCRVYGVFAGFVCECTVHITVEETFSAVHSFADLQIIMDCAALIFRKL